MDEPSVFGTSERNPVLGEVHCIGTESKLLECSHASIGLHRCGPQDFPTIPDIAVSCFGRYIWYI